jgi:hypothetical protein
MTKLMRNNVGREAQSMTDLMQVITQLTNQGFFAAWTGQEFSIRRYRIQGTKECETLNDFADKPIHRNHTLSLKFAQRHMDGPLIGACRTKAIARQISTLADAHASMANQQKSIPSEIIAAKKLPLEELILLGGQWPW